MTQDYRHSVLHVQYDYQQRDLFSYPASAGMKAPIDEHMQEWAASGWELVSITPVAWEHGSTRSLLFVWKWPSLA